MTYDTYKNILDRHLKINTITEFVKSLVKDNTSFRRYTTVFNLKPFQTRLIDSYYTSISIKLGNALEDVFKEYLTEKGVNFLPRDFVLNKDCDQIFQYNDTIFLIEQKIRDDHDSSKKIGQMENYNAKKLAISLKTNNYISCWWFIDPNCSKNKNYYETHLNKEELYYGANIELFLKNKVFYDDRCHNFFKEFITYFEKYCDEFSFFNVTDLTINFYDFTITELYRLLQSKRYINQIATIFFNGKIPFQDIYNYVEKGRNVPCKKNFKLLLKEYMA